MKKIIQIPLFLLLTASFAFAQFGKLGGLLGGGKNESSGMDKGAYLEQGKQLVQGYAKLQAAILEVGAAQAEAEGDMAAAESYRVTASLLTKNPTSENFEAAQQKSKEITEKQKDTEKRSVEYSEKGKKSPSGNVARFICHCCRRSGFGRSIGRLAQRIPESAQSGGYFWQT